MEQSRQHKEQPKSNRESLIRGPKPRYSEPHNGRNRIAITVKTPSQHSSEEFPPLPSNRKTSQPIIKHNDEDNSASPREDQRRPDTTQRTVPVGNGTVPVSNGHCQIEVIPGGVTVEPRTWRPDVFVQNFVPKAFLEINGAQAEQVLSREARGVNYEAYVSNFASPLFLPRNDLEPRPISSYPLVALDHIDLQNYERHFNDSVLMDWRAQELGMNSYNLFGKLLKVLNLEDQTFELDVPGLRENTPKVVYGDLVVLRQLQFEPGSSLLRGMDDWVNHGGRQQGTFT